MSGLNTKEIHSFIFESYDFNKLIDVLKKKGYRTIGPTLKDGTIVYGELNSVEQLPVGWVDNQDAGSYRLTKRTDGTFFSYVVGPYSLKKFLFPSAMRLWQAELNGSKFEFTAQNEEIQKFAFIGVRSCDIHALLIQDRVFLNGSYLDPHYKLRREHIFVLAVNCGNAAGTCFCNSIGTGPRATSGFDLALTEILDNNSHNFLVEIGTELGSEILNSIPNRKANEMEKSIADDITKKTIGEMGRNLNTSNIKELLYNNYENPRWDDVAKRCLTCANCTMVCPTCFCSTVEDITDLKGDNTERWRKWDSCFTMDFSYIHGGSIRSSNKSRYRQWITHKLATWIDQFGISGCVGCGRCITWCPVAIDITEEIQAIRENNPVTK
jgi:formate hydrogenlyase subunit 6/NADH:ubiquinone oxidoreductase subunit I